MLNVTTLENDCRTLSIDVSLATTSMPKKGVPPTICGPRTLRVLPLAVIKAVSPPIIFEASLSMSTQTKG